jgi:hypothetical protein
MKKIDKLFIVIFSGCLLFVFAIFTFGYHSIILNEQAKKVVIISKSPLESSSARKEPLKLVISSRNEDGSYNYILSINRDRVGSISGRPFKTSSLSCFVMTKTEADSSFIYFCITTKNIKIRLNVGIGFRFCDTAGSAYIPERGFEKFENLFHVCFCDGKIYPTNEPLCSNIESEFDLELRLSPSFY